MRHRLLVLGLAAGLGCSDFGPQRDLAVASDASSYVLGTSARFTATNRSRETVVFVPCGISGKIDRRVDRSVWAEVDAFGAFCITINSPLMLASGESQDFVISLDRTAYVGTLRVRVVVGERIVGISNRFTVTN